MPLEKKIKLLEKAIKEKIEIICDKVNSKTELFFL